MSGAVFAPNHVYVIPPNRYLSVVDGRFVLEGPVERSQLVLDLFLRSLAKDQKDNAVCIILSGTGAHGSQGVREVEAQGGFIVAQEPTEPQFPEMPNSAIAAGLVDIVCPVEQIPRALLDYVRHGVEGESVAAETDCLDEILDLLRAQGCMDFCSYRKRMLHRRIRRRMSLVHLSEINTYLGLLRSNPQELKRLESDLTIGVTRFFRDPGLFEELEKSLIPSLVAGKADDEPSRAWVAGCSKAAAAIAAGLVPVHAT